MFRPIHIKSSQLLCACQGTFKLLCHFIFHSNAEIEVTKLSHPRKPHVKLDIVRGLMEWTFDYGTIEEIKTQLDNEVASHSKVKPFFFLKEKLPQAFMQIGWMEDDFRNQTAKVWANFDNPTKRYDFSKVWLILCMSPSQVALF